MIGDLPHLVEADDKGKFHLASERFKNAGEVREECQAMIKGDKPRAAERAQVDAVANGFPVYSLARLKAKNQGWRARTNYRGLEAKLSDLGSIFYDLNVEVEKPARVFLDYGDSEDQRIAWQECIAEEYGRMLLRKWLAFDYHIPLRDTQMLRHGLGAHVWTVKGKWEPRTPLAGQILFPEDTSVDFYTQGVSFLLREFTPSEMLYGFIRNEARATEMGWNVDQVWKALSQASKAKAGDENLEELQRSMRNSDRGTGNRIGGVWLNYHFILEPETRKITLSVITEKGDDGGDEYLCKRRNYFDSFEDVVALFPYEIPSTGTLHGIRGFGARSREHFQMLDRVYNAMADNVMLSSYPMMKEIGSVDPDSKKLMKIGALNWLPKNSELQAVNLPNIAQGGIPLTNILRGLVNENNQNMLAGTPEPKDRETALSFQMRAQDTSRVSKAAHSLYYRNVTRTHTKMLLTAIKGGSGDEPWAVLAREFRKRVIAKGVPVQALDRIEDIEAVRSVGAGSASARLQALMTLWQTIYPTTTEDRKIAIERDLTAAVSGQYAQVDRYARNQKDKDLPGNDDSIAALENAALTTGQQVVASIKQDHVVHSQSHLAKAAEIIQAVDAGQMDPAQALGAIQAIGNHLVAHLQALAGNPMRKAEYDALEAQLRELGGIADQLQGQVEAMQEQEPPEQQASDKLQIGMAGVQADASVKQEKMLRDESRKDQKLLLDSQRKFGQAAADARLKAIRTQAEIENRRRTSKAA